MSSDEISDYEGKYEIFTLIDITDSNVNDTRLKEDKEYNQSQNLNVLLQVIGLRAQPFGHSVTELSKHGIKKYGFGSEYKGSHRVWKLEFYIDREPVWAKDDDEIFYLKHDCDKIAITTGLNDTADIKNAIFSSFSNEYKNITFNKI